MALGDVFGKIFGTSKAIENLTDKDNGLLVRAGGWVDGLSYTDQEKAEDRLLVRKWGLSQLEALAPFKVVQRILAFGVAFLWVFIGINTAAAIWVKAYTCASPVPGQEAQACINAADAMSQLAFSDYVLWPVMAVFSLYFMGGVWQPRGKKG